MLRTVTFLCLCLVTTIALAFEKSGLSIVTVKGSQKFEVERIDGLTSCMIGVDPDGIALIGRFSIIC